MICFFGDVHLRDDEPYYQRASSAVVDYLVHHPLNEEGNVFVFLGDLVDRYLSGPHVHRELVRLFSGLRAQTVIVRGNHDMRASPEGSYSDVFVYAPEVNPRVRVVREPEELSLEGLRALALPYLLPEVRMEEYASGVQWRGEVYDVVLGHFTLAGAGVPGGLTLGVEARQVVMGHIHEPVGPYLGSFFPCSIREPTPGRYLVYSAGQWRYEPLPVFLRILRVRYPDPLPPVPPGEVVALVVQGVASEELARQRYATADVYIRRVTASSSPEGGEAGALNREEVRERLLSIRGTLMDRKALIEEFLRVYPQEAEVAEILRGVTAAGGEKS